MDGHDLDGHDLDGHDLDGHDLDGHDRDGHDYRRRRDTDHEEINHDGNELFVGNSVTRTLDIVSKFALVNFS